MVRTVKTTINIDDELLARAKKAAARQGMTLTTFIEDALRARMLPVAARAKRFKSKLPIVKGKTPAAVDIDDRNALYDFMERE